MAEQKKRRTARRHRQNATTHPEGYVPSGCSILDLACTGKIGTGYRPGTMVNIVGDKHTGKTLLALSCLASCAWLDLPHKLKYYNTENEIGFDVENMFGKKLADRLEHHRLKPPHLIEEWRDMMIDEAEQTEPRVVVVDSIDAMSSESEAQQIQKEKKARESGEEVRGSYGTGKALVNSQLFRYVMGMWEKNHHILILVSQTRTDIGSQFGGQTRSGGKSLDFYGWHIMWLHHAGRLKKEVRGNKIEIGNTTRVLLSKNKETGRQWHFEFNSYPDYGLDDVEAMVDFLVQWKRWSKDKSGNIRPEDGMDGLETGKKVSLINQIEENGRVDELRALVQNEWDNVMEKASPNRQRRRRFE